MSEIKTKRIRHERRLKRTRKRILESAAKPRLTVYRSNKHMYAQIISDQDGKTLLSVHEKEITDEGKMTKIQKAEQLGKIIAQKAKAAGVDKIVFDKGAYRYHGRVKALADGARSGGLQF